jgi:ribonuclease Z
MTIRRIALVALIIASLLAAAGYLFRAPLSIAIAKKMVVSKLSADAMQDLADGLHVGLCGAGSPFPDEKRGGPCTLVIAGKRMFVFDAGNASVRNIAKMGFSHGSIEAIFLTHFHSDHIDGLGELLLQRWVSASNTQPVPVYGPVGVEQIVSGLMQTYAQDHTYRVAHHGEATMPTNGFGGLAKPFTPDADGRVVLLKDADLEIVAFNVDHAPVHPAVGYRISYKGRSVVLSGDTRKAAAVQREAAGVDLLVHEALSETLVRVLQSGAAQAGRKNLEKIFADIIDYHTTPEQAAEIARDAKVGYLLLSHIAPPLPLPGMESAFVGDASKIYSGPLQVGIDGDFISLPAGSGSPKVSRRF